jgi:hypothetical protein
VRKGRVLSFLRTPSDSGRDEQCELCETTVREKKNELSCDPSFSRSLSALKRPGQNGAVRTRTRPPCFAPRTWRSAQTSSPARVISRSRRARSMGAPWTTISLVTRPRSRARAWSCRSRSGWATRSTSRDGSLVLTLFEVKKTSVIANAMNSGTLDERKNMNFSGAKIRSVQPHCFTCMHRLYEHNSALGAHWGLPDPLQDSIPLTDGLTSSGGWRSASRAA